MKDLHEIKAEKENKVSELLKFCSVFFAFSNEQFHANKTPLAEGEKYVSIGAGGYMPKGKAQDFKKGLDDIDTWFKSEVKSQKLRRANIIYELGNYECWYTGEIEDAVNALGEDYTLEEIQEVYRTERNKQITARETA